MDIVRRAAGDRGGCDRGAVAGCRRIWCDRLLSLAAARQSHSHSQVAVQELRRLDDRSAGSAALVVMVDVSVSGRGSLRNLARPRAVCSPVTPRQGIKPMVYDFSVLLAAIVALVVALVADPALADRALKKRGAGRR
jgi:hypothetical protein